MLENSYIKHSKKTIKGWQRTLLIIFPYFIFVGVLQYACMIMLGLNPKSINQTLTLFQNLALSFSTLLATILVISMFIINVDKEDLISLGFRTTNILGDSARGLLMGASLITIGFFVLLFFGQTAISKIDLNTVDLVYSILLFLCISMAEEILFRGYILKNLQLSFTPALALIISAFIFSLIHIFNNNFSWLAFINIFLAGILLGIPYMRTKNLWFSIALHFSWNFTQGTIFGFNVSGHNIYSIVIQSKTLNNIWNGGLFGFEGSLLAFILQLIAIAILARPFFKKT